MRNLVRIGKRYAMVALAARLFIGCEEAVEWTFEPVGNGALTVEAIITDERKTQEIRLSLSYDELNGTPAPVGDAAVRVVGGGQTFPFRADADRPGRYVSERDFGARQGTRYTLEIDWQGERYTAENELVEARPFSPPLFIPVGADSLRLGEVAPLFLPGEQAMYEVDIDWSHLSTAAPNRAKLFFYTFNTIDINELFRPPKATVAFPRGSIVIIRKYGLHPSFAAYLRALLMETEWQGGVFDEASASLPSNISDGGLGFFAVCAVRSGVFVAR